MSNENLTNKGLAVGPANLNEINNVIVGVSLRVNYG